MKRLLIAVFSMFLFTSHFAFAGDVASDNNGNAVKVSHHHARSHAAHVRHSKADNTQSVDINHADAAALLTLKGIGAKKAAAIVAYRQAHGLFQSVNALTKVKGIGAKLLARLEKNNPGRLTASTR